jgi:DNA repair protein RadC
MTPAMTVNTSVMIACGLRLQTMRMGGPVMHEQIGLFQAEPPAPYQVVPIYRISLVRDGGIHLDRPKLRSSKDAAEVLRTHLGDTDREHFIVMLLDRKNRLIGINTVSIGSLTASIVHPREVMKPAILSNAAAMVLGHNHPSGDPQPSHEDKSLTKRLVQAGKVLGIDVLDHIIIGDGSKAYFSFTDEGILA